MEKPQNRRNFILISAAVASCQQSINEINEAYREFQRKDMEVLAQNCINELYKVKPVEQSRGVIPPKFQRKNRF